MNADASAAEALTHASERPEAGSPAPRRLLYSAGARVGKHTLVSLLGRGGMGEVWLARHDTLVTEHAIKFLDRTPEEGDDEDDAEAMLDRFRFEAQISARLGSKTKHIVGVHDAGSHEGTPYLVMEYVDGRTLENIMDELGAVPAPVVADVLDHMADALGVAHELGILHRDIKPSNIMLVGAPTPARFEAPIMAKLADFGVAKAVNRNSMPMLERPKETQRGLLVGSPAYMSPEQLRGDGALDPRSDMWALAVVAYEAVTGWPAFPGTSIADLIVAISTRALEPPSRVRPGLPPKLDAWFDRALAKDPSLRFSSVREMATTFRAALEPERAEEPAPRAFIRDPEPPPPRRGKVVGVLGAAALLLGAGALAVRATWLADTTPRPTVARLPAVAMPEVAPPPPIAPAPPTASSPAEPAQTATPSTPRVPARTTGVTRGRTERPKPAITASPRPGEPLRRPKEFDKSEIQ